MFHYSEGLREYVKWVNSDKQAFHDPIVISREVSHMPDFGSRIVHVPHTLGQLLPAEAQLLASVLHQNW